jgi:energy-coupling factor transport system permease protein
MSVFAFEPRQSPVHRSDPRLKLLSLALFSAAALALPPWSAHAVLSGGLLLLFVAARRNPLRALSGARLFLFLAAAVVLSHALAGGRLSAGGAVQGAGVAVRFLLVVFAADLLLYSTPTSRITDVIHWLLKPVPFVNAGRLALMTGLALRHAAVLQSASRQTTDALRVRNISARSTPVRYLRILAVCLVRETVLQAEQTTDALLTRRYGDRRTPPVFSWQRSDTTAAGLVLLVIVLAVLAAAPSVP